MTVESPQQSFVQCFRVDSRRFGWRLTDDLGVNLIVILRAVTSFLKTFPSLKIPDFQDVTYHCVLY